jgi:predicted nucleic acid-binding protein
MPDDRRVVVCNATPLIALSLIEQLHILQALYQTILIPPAVHEEVATGGASGIGVAELEASEWIRVVQLRDPARAELLSDLDRGEAEVLALALELTAESAIIDEKLARRHAKRLGIPLTGTLGVLLRAKRQGLIGPIRPFVERLRQGGIRLSEAVIEEALRLADE